MGPVSFMIMILAELFIGQAPLQLFIGPSWGWQPATVSAHSVLQYEHLSNIDISWEYDVLADFVAAMCVCITVLRW